MPTTCASITMYPWLIGGTTSIGSNSTAQPTSRASVVGFINMVFMVYHPCLPEPCCTRVPDVHELLHRKNTVRTTGKELMKWSTLSLRKRTIDKVIRTISGAGFESIHLRNQQVLVNYQAVFWNISYYDHPYFRITLRKLLFPLMDHSLKWRTKNVHSPPG